MYSLLKRTVLGVSALFVVTLFFPSTAPVMVWQQDDWSGGRGQELWEDPTMFYLGAGVDPWAEPGQLKLSRWNDCADIDADVVLSICEVSDTMYAGTGNDGDVYMSTDDGMSWSRISCTLTDAQQVYALVSHGSTVYAGVRGTVAGANKGMVFAITDGGTQCNDVTGDISTGAVFSLLRIGDTLYAGGGGISVYDGKIFRSTDGGSNWVNTLNLESQAVLALLHASDGSIWAGGKTVTRGAVWRSTDGGDNWSFISLLDNAVYALGEDESGAIYAGTATQGFVFRTENNGATWDTTKLDSYGVYSFLKTSTGELFAGTRSGYVHHTTDGSAWTTNGYLYGAPVWELFQASDSLIYAGTSASLPVFKFGPYRESGWIESSQFDSRCNQQYGWVDWIGTTGITVKVRTSSHFDMDWDAIEPATKFGDISGLSSVEDGDRYIQYWVYLETSNPDITPSLDLLQVDLTTVTDNQPPVFSTSVWTDTTYPGPFLIQSVITDAICTVQPESVYLYWSTDGWSTRNAVHMTQSGDTFSAEIDSLPEGDSVWYYIKACDLAWRSNCATDPRRGERESFLFWIVPAPPGIEYFPYDVCFRDTSSAGPYRIKCYVVDAGDGVDDSTVMVHWKFNWGEWESAVLQDVSGGRYVGWVPQIPDPAQNTLVQYYVAGCDVFNPPLCSQRPPYDPCTFYYVAAGDVVPLEIRNMSPIIHQGYTYKPAVVMTNAGRDLVPAVKTTCRILDGVGTEVWKKTTFTPTSLSGGQLVYLEFGEWTVPLGDVDYQIVIFTQFANDTVPENDTLTLMVEVGIEETSFVTLPKVFGISQNYPNPFSSFSVINYQVPDINRQPIHTLIRVYDAAGKIVKTLVDEPKHAGYYTVRWDATNTSGRTMASGIYFYKINAGDFVVTKKMILVR
ncbi:hypothetical protein AMJ40_04680 [candidate division TA06 bacterium DG_26]|uniref:FlgD/Vpr Ig-like domain-containing protein n=1 Tax=candidate division TA06 bacterium DG_26 TaxID=1703771 RepID=A0A0S7WIU9_UNCT6|nr:MAG: hypothetical protein AMJ40_04680 [candidate division TA06 bacterium DG_26]